MFALLKQIDPPLGFGSKCPDLLSYKRLVRMNMPIDDEGRVNFTTTLFALVRVNLQGCLPRFTIVDNFDEITELCIICILSEFLKLPCGEME